MAEDITQRDGNAETRPTGTRHRLTYDASGDIDLGLAVVEAICEALDLGPTEIGGKLHEYVDVDAMNRLFRDRSNGEPRLGGRIAFRTNRYDIVIHSTGIIDVTELEIDGLEE